MANKTSKQKDKKITILDRIIHEDEMGGWWEESVPLPGGENIWAYYRQASGSEFYAAAAIQSKVEAIFEIRWRNDVHTSMKILYKGDEYSITRIDDFEGNKESLTIYAYKVG